MKKIEVYVSLQNAFNYFNNGVLGVPKRETIKRVKFTFSGEEVISFNLNQIKGKATEITFTIQLGEARMAEEGKSFVCHDDLPDNSNAEVTFGFEEIGGLEKIDEGTRVYLK